MKSKKAFVSEMVSWAIAVLILTFAFALIMIISVFDIAAGPNVKIEGLKASSVCNHDLLNFLRADTPESVTFAELAGLSQADAEIQKKFTGYASDYFKNNFRRGNNGQLGTPNKQGWSLQLLDEEYVPLASLGTLSEANIFNSCSQTIPNYKGGVLTARLGLEY